MTTKFTQAEVYDFWTKQAHEHGQSSAASWSDHRVIEMEIQEITKRLNDGDRVLDAGCANGYSSLQFACARRIRLRGLDYIPKMIEQARLRAAGDEGQTGWLRRIRSWRYHPTQGTFRPRMTKWSSSGC